MTENKPIKLEDIPQDLLNSISDELMQYSVGLYLEAQQLGSGTLIRCGERLGILTAHHVVHRPTPPLDFSPSSSQELQLVIMGPKHEFKIPAKYINEIEIGVPNLDKEGPDLTFLEFPSMDKIGSLRAIKSFWNLDHDTENRLASTANDSGVWAITGLPNEWEKIQKESEQKMTIYSKFNSFFGFAISDRRYKSNDFDFVDIPVYYGGRDTPPNSFGGVSGGGLWKIKIGQSQGESKLIYKNPIFCGVPFYQQEIEDGNLLIRCHYAESIYKKVRQSLLPPSHDVT